MRPFAADVGAAPGRLRVAFSTLTPAAQSVHPDLVAAVQEAARLCADLGHEVVERDLPGLDQRVNAADDVVYRAAVGWILAYGVRKCGREPGVDEIEPLARAQWDESSRISAADYLLAVEDLQRFSRTVARFFTDVDVWLTPTLGEPPVPLSELVSTPEEPLSALERTFPGGMPSEEWGIARRSPCNRVTL